VTTGNRTGYGVKGLNPDEWAGRTKVPRPKSDAKVDKWTRWIERIHDEVIEEIFTNRAAFVEVTTTLDANPKIPWSDILDYWVGNYGRSQAVAVRRQTDTNPQSVTLRVLLAELEADRHRITREWWVGQFEWGHQGLGDRNFDQWAYLDPDAPADSETGTELSALRIRHDIERLEAAASSIREHVDKVIAHSDRKRPATTPTFADLDAAIDVLGDVFTSYYCLLTLNSLVKLDATPQYDRLGPFRLPWIAD
jgi:AbiU2